MEIIQESLFEAPPTARPEPPLLPPSWGGKRAIVYGILVEAYKDNRSDWVPKYQIHDEVGDTMRNRISEVRFYLRTIGWTIENRMTRAPPGTAFADMEGPSYGVWLSWYRIRPLVTVEE